MRADKELQQKLISPEDLLDIIKPGNRIFLSSGPAMPSRSVSAIIGSESVNAQDLELIQLITLGDLLTRECCREHHFRLKTFNIGESIVRELSEGHVDFIPANLIEIPLLLGSGAVGIDVAIVTASPPDTNGYMSLGVAVDVSNIAVEKAPIVIAEINPSMPVTYGETLIHVNQVHHVIESDIPILERQWKMWDQQQEKIGWHIANLIEDGSTVALHAGRMFDAIASHLKTKRDLGVYTNVISDWAIDLVESGAVPYNRSRYRGGQITTSYCYGTREIYDYVARNPIIEFYPIPRLANPNVISRIPNLISIMNVKKIDISGESVIFHSGDNLLTGYESKFIFAMAAAMAKRGKTIIALRSVDQDGKSNIVISHDQWIERVRATLGIARYVVTEYGVANLFGKSIRERVLSLIDIAHPDHREELLEKAKQCGYVYKDQIYAFKDAANYPMELETMKTFKDGLEVRFRPIKASDEDMMRRLFYQFSDESKYLRYFARVSVMPHREMQKYVNIDYRTTLSIVGVITRNRSEDIIAEARYSYYPKEKIYELAFIVDEEYQGKGISTFMAEYLVKIARERGLTALCANVLPENKKMLQVFNKVSAEHVSKFSDGVVTVKFNLK
ncbi:MAG TPA: GNAT family N-acetyltransferase [Spirochaetota bacterium]|nr:GNAT family N-acetyltransferase [Spirochaetota bacterium]HOD16548.1 GNAT family N-acetyltransferase [Spirochaetota bacterium]HPG51317.1 GNAT family N-acetyltransferase [Spirochaetota bacterium]HPN10692.1 GNAT family N-acetyltransferase [Spirochaetota bacterium]HQL81209.1 GNAT family N-acetyltransferase [Spirochaetota bacterium]